MTHRLYYLNPFSLSPNEFGAVLNDHCQIVPRPNDWILLTDHDVMTFDHVTHKVIHAAIDRYPGTGIFGAVTNRLSWKHQRIGENTDYKVMREHYAIAKALADRYPKGECVQAKYVAGFFMLFRKDTWQKAGGFQKQVMNAKNTLFDYEFCLKVAALNLPIRVILGAYYFHYYRMHKRTNDNKHLKG